MRRIILFVLVALAATFSLSHASEITFFGSIESRMTANDNLEDAQSSYNDDKTYMDTKLILGIKSSFNDYLRGIASFEAGSIIWGIDGENYPAGRNSGGGSSGDGVNLETKNIYLDIDVPGQHINFKCGLMPFSVADDILAGDDAFGFRLSIGDELNARLNAIRLYQESMGSRYNLNVDDPDRKESFVSLEAQNKFNDTFSANILLGYLYDRYNGQPGNEIDRDIHYLGAGVTLSLLNTSTSINYIYDGGKIGESDVLGNAPVDIDLSGYLVSLKTVVDFSSVDILLEGIYATGDNENTPDKDEGFIVPESSYKTDIAEIMTRGALSDELEGDGDYAAYQYILDFNNIFFVKCAIDIEVNKKTSTSLAVIYATLPESKEIKPGDEKAKKVGTEIDLKWSYKIYTADDQVKGLRLDIIGAVLFVGDVFDEYIVATDKIKEADDIYEYGVRLVYDF